MSSGCASVLAQRLLGPWGPCTHASSPSSAASGRADLRSLEGDLTARGCPTPSSAGGKFRKVPGIVGNFRKLSPDAVIRGACSRRAHAQSAHDNRQTAYVV